MTDSITVRKAYKYRLYRCGIPDAARFPHRIGGLWEFPISAIRIGGVNIPFSGGFYARFWPYVLLKQAI